MKLCPLCERIKEIRIQQRKSYLTDLCPECREKEIYRRIKSVKKIVVIS
ncbi:MAG: hypothetical protein PWR10_1873 [Halanaerobiales bacterium]|nr:hypothetical protein [Halanaerobiales bacterium]